LIASAEEAADLIKDGMVIGASGFTPSGYPKAVPLALAERVKKTGERLKASLYTGASAGPELDGAWAEAGIVSKRLPYQTDERIREGINGGSIEADIFIPKAPPCREAIPILRPGDRIGLPYIPCGSGKIAAIVLTDLQDSTRPLSAASETEKRISGHIIDFFNKEIAAGRLTKELLPLQSGVGSAANAVLRGLGESNFSNLTFYTEVIQDSMLDLLRSGKATLASATTLSPSPPALERFEREIGFFKDKIILRPQELSNHPEIVRRLGVIAINTAIEADIYGNVNSTHIMGSKMMNGIGGSGDFARNAYLTIFSTASTAKGGAISSIVPFVSHVDHTEHDVMVIVTEQGCADLRGLSPKERAVKIIENCAHPDYKGALEDYYKRALASSMKQTPHILDEALSWHSRFQRTGRMNTGTN
jgi:succinyl-CoA:acetate CoA-transferase